RKTTRSSLAQALLFSPMLAAELGAVGVRPDAFPAVFAGGIERKTCCIAGAVGYRHEILVADAGADIARAGDVPGHAVGIAGALHGDGAAVARAAARVGALDVVFAFGPRRRGGDAQKKRGRNDHQSFVHDRSPAGCVEKRWR